MLGRLAQWNEGEHFSTIRADWLSRAAGVGETIRVRMADRELTGRFERIDDSGHLILELPEGGKQTVIAGDVVALEPSGPSPPPPSTPQEAVMANGGDELVFAPLGGVGEIGMNLAHLRHSAPVAPAMDYRRRRRVVRERGAAAGRRPDPARYPLPDRAAQECPRHRADACARGSFRRAHRSVATAQAADLRDAVHRRVVRSQAAGRARRAGNSDQCRAARRPSFIRPVRYRIRFDGAFDSGIEWSDSAHTARHGAPHRRLEDRSYAGDRSADRRGQAACARQ